MGLCFLDTTGRGGRGGRVPGETDGRQVTQSSTAGAATEEFSFFWPGSLRLRTPWRSGPRIAWRVSRRSVTEDILRQRLSINVRSLRHGAGLTLKKASER